LAIAAQRAKRSARKTVTAVEKLAMNEAVKAAKEASREEAERRRLKAEEDRLLIKKVVEEKRLWREKQAREKDNDKKCRENEWQKKASFIGAGHVGNDEERTRRRSCAS
jgi:hypothetical protein